MGSQTIRHRTLCASGQRRGARDLREMANIAGKRLLSGTAISPAARNPTRLLDIPGRLSQCLRRAVRFWLTAAPRVDLHNPGIDQSVWAPFARRAPRVAPFGSGLAGWPIRATGAPNRPPVQPLRTRALFERNDKDNSRLPGRDHARCARVNTSLPERLQITLGSRSRLALAFDIRKTEAGKL